MTDLERGRAHRRQGLSGTEGPADPSPTVDATELGDALRAALRRLDPVPAEVVDAARDAFAGAARDARVAPLVFDSLVDEGRVPDFGDEPARVLVFRTGEIGVVLRVLVGGGPARLRGSLVGPAIYRVLLRGPGRVAVTLCTPGEASFDTELPPRGPLSLELAPAGDDPGAVLVTEWVVV